MDDEIGPLAAALGADEAVVAKARRILAGYPIPSDPRATGAAALLIAFALCGAPRPEREVATAARVPLGSLERATEALAEGLDIDVVL